MVHLMGSGVEVGDIPINLLSNCTHEISDFENSITVLGYGINRLDITKLRSKPKKEILFVGKDVIEKLDKKVFEEKLTSSYYIFPLAYETSSEMKKKIDGVVDFPISQNDMQNILSFCGEKSFLQGELSSAKTEVDHFRNLSDVSENVMGILHDLNNFNSITIQSLELLRITNQKETKSDKIERLVGHALRGSDKLNQLVKRNRTLLESATQETSKDFYSLREMITQASSMLREELKSSSITLDCHIPKSILLECEEIVLVQVLLNLIKNAIFEIKNLHTRWIKIEVEYREDDLVVNFVDSGAGIDESVRSRIFDLYFTTKSKVEGTGLGLSLCKKELHRQGMELIYVRGKNTKFSIIVPNNRFQLGSAL